VRISNLADINDWTRKEIEEQLASMRAVTVPVNVQIRGQQRIFVLSEMEKILKEAELIALGECGCRKKLNRCDKPLDVCITLDKSAEDQMAEVIREKWASLRRWKRCGARMSQVSFT